MTYWDTLWLSTCHLLFGFVKHMKYHLQNNWSWSDECTRKICKTINYLKTMFFDLHRQNTPCISVFLLEFKIPPIFFIFSRVYVQGFIKLLNFLYWVFKISELQSVLCLTLNRLFLIEQYYCSSFVWLLSTTLILIIKIFLLTLAHLSNQLKFI